MAETYNLATKEELRVEVDSGKPFQIQLLSGTAEIFGNEMPVKAVFDTLTPSKFAIFSWHGATIQIKGSHHAYVATETPMDLYIEQHAKFESLRRIAHASNTAGPRILIVGATDTGKSSLAKILLGYAARHLRKVIFADLDIGQGCITIPGMISAIHADRPFSIDEGFSKRAPLAYFYGHNSLDKNEELYNRQVANLFSQIDDVATKDHETQSSGVIINTCGWVTGLGYKILAKTIDTTRADHVLVMDNERLYSDLVKDYQSKGITFIKLPKSGGVVTRDTQFRRNTRRETIRQYFYGAKRDLSPRPITLNWAAIALYRVGGAYQAPACALPIGTESVQDPVGLELIDPSIDLERSIAAVSFSTGEDTLLDFNIAGYLHIQSVNVERRKITFLAPCSMNLPSRYLLVGDIEWIDSN